MPIKVRIPSPLRRVTAGQGEVKAEGTNIAEVIESLETQFPGFKERICDEKGEIRRFVNIYVNEEDCRFLKGKETCLKEGDEVSIIPAMAGGGKTTTLRVRVTFPEEKVTEPIIYQIGHEYRVVTNIRRADVREKTGWVELELSGDMPEIERALQGLKKKGVMVDPIERNVVE